MRRSKQRVNDEKYYQESRDLEVADAACLIIVIRVFHCAHGPGLIVKPLPLHIFLFHLCLSV